jgi:hypothetical protein
MTERHSSRSVIVPQMLKMLADVLADPREAREKVLLRCSFTPHTFDVRF